MPPEDIAPATETPAPALVPITEAAPFTVPTSATPPPSAPVFEFPADFESRPYAKEILASEKPGEEFIRRFEEISARAEGSVKLPAADAPQEEWEKLAEKFRPEDPSVYKIDSVALAPEEKQLQDFLNENRSPEWLGKVRGVFQKVGLPPALANKLAAEFTAIEVEEGRRVLAASHEALAAQEKEFDAEMQKTFGPKWEEVVDTNRQFLAKSLPNAVPQHLRGRLREMDTQDVMVLAAILDHIYKTRLKEDSLSPASRVVAPSTLEDLRMEMRKAMSDSAYSNPHSPSHESAKKRVNSLAADITRAEQHQ